MGLQGFIPIGTFVFRLQNGLNENGTKVVLWRSSAEVKWKAPGDCPCNKVVLYQIADTTQVYEGILWGINTDTKPWHHDPIEIPDPEGARSTIFVKDLPPGQISEPDEAGTILGQSNSVATTVDAPGWTDNNPRYIKLVQNFETCAICDDKNSARNNEIFGCITWKIVVIKDANGAIKKIGHVGGGMHKVESMEGGKMVDVQTPMPGVRPTDKFLSIINKVRNVK